MNPKTKKKTLLIGGLAVVALILVVGMIIWYRNKVQTGANVNQPVQEQLSDEEQLATGNDEWKVGEDKVALRSGTLVREEGDPRVYLIYRGTKSWITSASVFDGLRLNWGNIVVRPAEAGAYLNLYTNGPDINSANDANLPNGLVVRFAGEPQVYSVFEGKLKWYPSPSVFSTRHSVSEISDFALSSKKMSIDPVPFHYRGGNLVQAPSDPKVYWVASNMKYWIPTPEIFDNLGFNWANRIVAEDGILTATNPNTNKPMYIEGQTADKLTNLPLLIWSNSSSAQVHLIKYYSATNVKDLLFTDSNVIANRFNATEINTVSHYTAPTSPPPSSSGPPPSSSGPTPLPSGSVKCTVSGNAYYTDWTEMALTDYAHSTYPYGLTKMYEVTRVDGSNNLPRTKFQVIFNIQNTTHQGSNQFVAGDRIQILADLYYSQAVGGATRIAVPGQFDLYLTKTDNSHVADWRLDSNEFPTTIEVGNHYQVHIHDQFYTLPANIDYTQVKFLQKYWYGVGDSTCHWPADGTELTVFEHLSQ